MARIFLITKAYSPGENTLPDRALSLLRETALKELHPSLPSCLSLGEEGSRIKLRKNCAGHNQPRDTGLLKDAYIYIFRPAEWRVG